MALSLHSRQSPENPIETPGTTVVIGQPLLNSTWSAKPSFSASALYNGNHCAEWESPTRATTVSEDLSPKTQSLTAASPSFERHSSE